MKTVVGKYKGEDITLGFGEDDVFEITSKNQVTLVRSQVGRVHFHNLPGSGIANITTRHGSDLAVDQVKDMAPLMAAWRAYEYQVERPKTRAWGT